MVVHLPNLFAEMDNLRKKGLTDIESRLLVSERAHIVFDLHQAADGAQEAGRGSSAIGTTRKVRRAPHPSSLAPRFHVHVHIHHLLQLERVLQ